MDPVYGLQASDFTDSAGAVSLTLMGLGLLVVTLAALLEHWTTRSNIVTRALDRWSR